MPTANTCEIVLGTTSLEVTRNPTADNSTELIPKSAISLVAPIKINGSAQMEDPTQWTYRFAEMIMFEIVLNNGKVFNFDVQEVTNQAGWTADLAGQQQAVADINTWLP